MKSATREVRQNHVKIIFLILLSVLLSFGLSPSKIVAPANDELASEVLNSVIILDSYVLTHSGDSYELHVLTKKGANFIPVQIQSSPPITTYKTMSLRPNPRQRCPFADKKTEEAGISASLERGELIAYNSYPISNSSFVTANTKSVDLIVDVRGDLFLVKRVHVFGGCFWAQE